jgi:hypothetical protein
MPVTCQETLTPRFVGLDGEASIGDFRCDNGLRKLANYGELITKSVLRASNHAGMLTTAVPLPSVTTVPS